MPHASPNNAAPGSFVYAAEEWFLSIGMTIPHGPKLKCSYQAMLDDFIDSGQYHPSFFEASNDLE